MNSYKENEIRVFGFAIENILENDFPVFGNILKMLFFIIFSHFLNNFLIFETNFITENFKIYT